MTKGTLNTGRQCRECGCTDDNACVHKQTGIACHWVCDDVCSACLFPELRLKYFWPDGPLPQPSHAAQARAAGRTEIEAMTDAEVAAELGSLQPRFTPAMFDRLEGELYVRAACLGWTGDPLKQPARSALAAARKVADEQR